MAATTLTIRNIDASLEERRRTRATQHGKSMEEEARDILGAALLAEPRQLKDLGQTIRNRFAPLGGVDLPDLAREPIREATDLPE